MKPLPIYGRWQTQQCSAQPLPCKWLFSLICCTTTAQHVHVSWPETVTPEGYAEQLWNTPQYPHHNNKIWKLWQCRCPCSPGHHSPGPFVTRPHYGHMRKWIIWQIQWGTQYSPSLGWITRSILATSGLACPLGTCHPPTHIHWRVDIAYR